MHSHHFRDINQIIDQVHAKHSDKNIDTLIKELRAVWTVCVENSSLSDKNRLKIFNDNCIATLEQLKEDLKIAKEKLSPIQKVRDVFDLNKKLCDAIDARHKEKAEAIITLEIAEQKKGHIERLMASSERDEKIKHLEKSIAFVEELKNNIGFNVNENVSEAKSLTSYTCVEDMFSGAFMGACMAFAIKTTVPRAVSLFPLSVGLIITGSLLGVPVGAMIRGQKSELESESPAILKSNTLKRSPSFWTRAAINENDLKPGDAEKFARRFTYTGGRY